MQAVEFEATIENGIVRIPPQYEELKNTKATFVVMYEDTQPELNNNIEAQLNEFDRLRNRSDNKIQATKELATDTSGMMDDGIF